MEECKSSEIWVTKFDEESSRVFREQIVASSRGDSMKPIVVYIDSYGGAVDSLANMIETLDSVSNPIVTVCLGKAMSCGAILLSHGDFRFCGKHSRIMIHEVSSGTYGDVHDMHADVQEAKRLNEHFMGILAKNCGLKNYSELRKLIKDQDGRDKYLDAHQAVQFGIVDAVGTPRVMASAMYEIILMPEKRDFSAAVNEKPKAQKKSNPTKKTNSKKGHK